MTPENLLKAFDRFEIQNNLDHTKRLNDLWFVVDTSTAEPDVNWPGDLVSEHDSRQEGRLGWAAAIIKAAEQES